MNQVQIRSKSGPHILVGWSVSLVLIHLCFPFELCSVSPCFSGFQPKALPYQAVIPLKIPRFFKALYHLQSTLTYLISFSRPQYFFKVYVSTHFTGEKSKPQIFNGLSKLKPRSFGLNTCALYMTWWYVIIDPCPWTSLYSILCSKVGSIFLIAPSLKKKLQ